MLVLVHVVYSLSRSIASRNLTGWEWLGIALFYIRVWLSKLGHFFLPMSPQMLISGLGTVGGGSCILLLSLRRSLKGECASGATRRTAVLL